MPAPAALSYVSGTSELPLLGQTIGDNLDATAARFGDRDALVECATGRRWTYAEFVADVDRLAKGLLARGWASASASAVPSLGARPPAGAAEPARLDPATAPNTWEGEMSLSVRTGRQSHPLTEPPTQVSMPALVFGPMTPS